MDRKKKKYPCVSKKKNKAKVELMKRNRLIRYVEYYKRILIIFGDF